MINIGKSIKYYENNGFKHLNAISKVAQDIILFVMFEGGRRKTADF